jgi:hypothetical protein
MGLWFPGLETEARNLFFSLAHNSLQTVFWKNTRKAILK